MKLKRIDRRLPNLSDAPSVPGTTEDGGLNFKLEGEGLTKFQEAMDDLGLEEIPLKITVVKVSDLGEREILTPAECRVLRWLLAEEATTAGGE